jgi:competence protein ComEC
MLWSPVAFGLGAAGYLELKAEPSWLLLAGLAAGLAMLAALVGRRSARPGLSALLVLATFMAAGALAGKVRSTLVAAPILAGDRTVMTVEGFVVDVVSPGAGGPRLLIAPVAVSDLAPQDTPKR